MKIYFRILWNKVLFIYVHPAISRINISPRFLCRPMAFFRLTVAVVRQRALHTENSRFASPTLGWHISTFRGYRILLSIRNPYINRFTNHFSIHSYKCNHLTLRKWCYTPLQQDFALDPIILPFDFHFRIYKRDLAILTE